MNTKYRLLYAEDDPDLPDCMIPFLTKQGFEVIFAKDGNEAWEKYQTEDPDVLLLDSLMPGKSGQEITKLVRKRDTISPTVFLTSVMEGEEAIHTLKMGADDYIRKDTIMEGEMVQRLFTTLRRSPKRGGLIRLSNFSVLELKEIGNKGKRVLHVKDKTTALCCHEYGVLRYLVNNCNHLVQREDVAQCVWGLNTNALEYLNKTVSILRKLFRPDPEIKIIAYKKEGLKIQIDVNAPSDILFQQDDPATE